MQVSLSHTTDKVVDIEKGITVGFVLDDDGKTIHLVAVLLIKTYILCLKKRIYRIVSARR